MSRNISTTSLPAPVVKLSSMPSAVPAETEIQVNFQAQVVASKVISSVTLEYSLDGGTTWVAEAPQSRSEPYYLWKTPVGDHSNVKVRMIAKDSRGLASAPLPSNIFNIIASHVAVSVNVNALSSRTSSVTFSGTCATGAGLTLQFFGGRVPNLTAPFIAHYDANEASVNAALVCSNQGTWTLTLNEATTEGVFSYFVRQSDTVGHQASVAFTWAHATTAPKITVGSLKINQDNSWPIQTSKRNVRFSLNATHPILNIAKVCIKKVLEVNAAPSAPINGADASCVPLTSIKVFGQTQMTVPAANLNLDMSYSMGVLPNPYKMYVWVADETGMVSTSSATLGTDLAKAAYALSNPPVIANIAVTNVDVAHIPIIPSEMSAPQGSDVYIKWMIDDANGGALQDISLSYTTDEVNYYPIQSGLTNSINGGCGITYTVTAPAVAPQTTGCFRWTSPSNTYFKIRVTVKNSKELIASAASGALNTNSFHWLAGNTDLGTGGSAEAAVFINKDYNPEVLGDSHTLVVASDGTVYYRDWTSRGILKIDPLSGVVSSYIKRGAGTTSTSPIALSSARVNYAQEIAIDYQDRLLIWDGPRILRVDPVANTVQTIIGGGGNLLGTASVSATSIGLSAPNSAMGQLFQPLPNGDILFQGFAGSIEYSSNPMIGIYSAQTGTVKGIPLSGIGAQGNPTRNMADLSPGGTNCGSYTHTGPDFLKSIAVLFNPTTSALTAISGLVVSRIPGAYCNTAGISFDPVSGISLGAGLHLPFPVGNQNGDISNYTPSSSISVAPTNYVTDPYTDSLRFNARNGDLYSTSRKDAVLQKFDPSLNQWKIILGGKGNGHCEDGTLATQCAVQIFDAFVTLENQLYFVDGGTIRTIDDNGKVQTLFGQSRAYGDGNLALTARFNRIRWLDRKNNGKIVIADASEHRIREFTEGAQISGLAGNGNYAGITDGSVAGTSALDLSAWDSDQSMIALPGTNDLLVSQFHEIFQLSSLDGKWHRYGGTAAASLTAYDASSADGMALKYIDHRYIPVTFGVSNSSILTIDHSWDGYQSVNALMKTYDRSTYVQSHLAGQYLPMQASQMNSFCPDGGAVSTCWVPHESNVVRASWDNVAQRWLVSTDGGIRIAAMKAGGTVSSYTLPSGNGGLRSFVYVSLPTATAAAPAGTIYYCSTNGKLYKVNVDPGNTAPAASVMLPWPSSTVACAGASLIYDPGTGPSPVPRLIFPITQHGLSGVAEYVNP